MQDVRACGRPGALKYLPVPVLQVVVQKNSRHRVEVHAPPPLHMRRALRAAFSPCTGGGAW